MSKAQIRAMIVSVGFLAMCGCGAAIRVTKNGQTISGVPFYVKQGKCFHQMVYLMPYYQLTLQTQNGDKVVGSETISVSEATYSGSKMKEIQSLLRVKPPLSSGALVTINNDWIEISANPISPYKAAAEGTWPKYLVSNSNSPKSYVDYAIVYTANAKAPFSGSANASFKLASDGTLTDASSQVTDDTFKTVLGALPIADLIKSTVLKGAAPTSENPNPPPTELQIQLAVEHRAIKISNSQSLPYKDDCPDLTEMDKSLQIGSTIEDIGSNTAATDTQKGAENSISITGKITLPKAASPATGSPSGSSTGGGNTATPPKPEKP